MTTSQRTVVGINVCLLLFMLFVMAMGKPGLMPALCVPAAPLFLMQLRLHIVSPMSLWVDLITANAVVAVIQIYLWKNPKPWLAALLSMYFATGIFLTGFVIVLLSNWRGE